MAALEARIAATPAAIAGLDAASFEELAARLDSRDLLERARAGEALARRMPEMRLEALDLLRTGTRRQREAVAVMLSSRASADMAADLARAHEANDEPRVRCWIDLALGRAGAAESTPLLVADLAHPDELVRISAVQALARVGDPRAAPELAQLAASRRGLASSMASEALASLGEPAMGFLAAAWPGLGPREREAVLSALEPMRGPEVDRFLAERLEDASPLVALQAARLLGLRGDMAGRELALERLRSEDPAVARAARAALDAMEAAP